MKINRVDPLGKRLTLLGPARLRTASGSQALGQAGRKCRLAFRRQYPKAGL